MIIRYSSIAAAAMERLRQMDENEYHSLRGLIILLSTDPAPDDEETENKEKIKLDFGGGIEFPVYIGLDWWIAYRSEDNEEALRVIAVRNVARPPR